MENSYKISLCLIRLYAYSPFAYNEFLMRDIYARFMVCYFQNQRPSPVFGSLFSLLFGLPALCLIFLRGTSVPPSDRELPPPRSCCTNYLIRLEIHFPSTIIVFQGFRVKITVFRVLNSCYIRLNNVIFLALKNPMCPFKTKVFWTFFTTRKLQVKCEVQIFGHVMIDNFLGEE